jgi:membrane associated rhomboid family serine protease
MAKCDQCGREENMPYQCRYCGGTFCAEHRLPENHDCPGLQEWDDPDGVWDDDSGGVFDSGFDDSVASEGGRSGSVLSRLGISTGPGGFLAYFRGNMTYTFLALMWITFLLQFAVAYVLDPFGNIGLTMRVSETWAAIFTLQPDHPLYVWTWVTSVFSHGGFYHIVGNSIVIFFFGRLIEEYVGTRDFTLLFLASGILAGLGQIAIMLAQGITTGGVLGASGAGLAIMGALTVLNPDLKVYVYFILPVPIWVITGFYAVISVLGAIGGQIGVPAAGGIAHGAHLIGLVIGLWYGQRVKDRISLPRQLQFGGGGGPGGPGGPGGGRRRF